jgi:hypothetical protein
MSSLGFAIPHFKLSGTIPYADHIQPIHFVGKITSQNYVASSQMAVHRMLTLYWMSIGCGLLLGFSHHPAQVCSGS